MSCFGGTSLSLLLVEDERTSSELRLHFQKSDLGVLLSFGVASVLSVVDATISPPLLQRMADFTATPDIHMLSTWYTGTKLRYLLCVKPFYRVGFIYVFICAVSFAVLFTTYSQPDIHDAKA